MIPKWFKEIVSEEWVWEHEGYVKTDERVPKKEVLEEREKGYKEKTTYCKVWRHPDTGEEKLEEKWSIVHWRWFDEEDGRSESCEDLPDGVKDGDNARI